MSCIDASARIVTKPLSGDLYLYSPSLWTGPTTLKDRREIVKELTCRYLKREHHLTGTPALWDRMAFMQVQYLKRGLNLTGRLVGQEGFHAGT
jgi:hypothetical protein